MCTKSLIADNRYLAAPSGNPSLSYLYTRTYLQGKPTINTTGTIAVTCSCTFKVGYTTITIFIRQQTEVTN